jgi:DNA-binding transcriptional LysR family regulator
MRATSIEELRMIAAVEAHGSLSAAAESLGVSQQAVSQRMRSLERRWSLPLFARTARGTTLTPHGALVAEWAGALLAQVNAFDHAVLALRSDRAARVRVGASLTIAEHLVPGWLVTYATEPHAARVELTVVNSATVVDRVRSGADDLGFIETPDVPEGLAVRVIGRDEIGIVVSPQHSWAARASVSAAELAATPLVGREPGSGTRLALERALGAAVGADAIVEPAAELATTAGIRATLVAGGGVGALSLRAVRDDLDGGRLVRVKVEGLVVSRPLAAIWHPGRPLLAGASRLLALASTAAL